MREIILNLNSSDKKLYHDTLIRQGENKASVLKIILTDEFIGYDYLLLFKLNDNPIISSLPLEPIDGVLEYEIGNGLTHESGEINLVLNAFDENGVIVKSATTTLRVVKSLDGTTSELMPEDYVPWFIQILGDVEVTKSELETVIDEGVLVKGQIEEKIIEFGTIVNTYGSLVGK